MNWFWIICEEVLRSEFEFWLQDKYACTSFEYCCCLCLYDKAFSCYIDVFVCFVESIVKLFVMLKLEHRKSLRTRKRSEAEKGFWNYSRWNWSFMKSRTFEILTVIKVCFLQDVAFIKLSTRVAEYGSGWSLLLL